MKIVLINPPIYMPDRALQLYYPNGLLSVAGAWRAKGHDIFVVDAPAGGWDNQRWEAGVGRWFHGLEFAEIMDRVIAQSPDLVGITIPFSVQAFPAFVLADRLRTRLNAPVVAGGHHASVRAQECLEHFDAVIVGEGEEVDPESIEAGIIHGTKIKDLDSLPFPARDLFPMQAYFDAASGAMIHGISGIDKWASVITSRGCPYKCSFCAIGLTMGRQWRARSVDHVLAEFAQLYTDFGVTHFVIEDDNFTLNARRTNAILDGLIASGNPVNLYAPNGLRADALDAEMMSRMVRAGFKEIWISPESGSQRVLDEVIGKQMDLKVIERVVKDGVSTGLKVSCFFVIGIPGETVAEIDQTIAFARKLRGLGMHRYAWGYATPYWGTKLHSECLDRGMIDGMSDGMISPGMPTINNPDLPPAMMLEFRQRFII